MNLSVSFLKTRQVKHVLARAIACGLMLLALPSCAIPHFRPGEAAPGLPTNFFNGATNPQNSAQLGIEEFFNDPVLTHLLDQGLFGNRELKIMDEEVQIARNEILARQGAYLPFITFGAEVGMDRPSLFTPLGAAEDQLLTPSGRHFPDPLPNYMGALNLFWQLDIWRELRNARDAAAQRYVAASEKRNYFVTRLVAEIAEKYYSLMALDKRLEVLDQTIALQEQSYTFAKATMEAGRGKLGDLPVRRFLAEVRKNQSEKLIVAQEIIEVENRINFLVNRFPQPVERMSARFFDLSFPLSVGLPAQLLQNRPDIRQAERELEATGLDVKVARAHFFPKVGITAGVGYQAFDPKFLFNPDALIYNTVGNLVVPLVNKKAIQAEFLTANAKQLESLYTYQRVVLDAFTEVVNRVSMVENYSRSLEIKKQQLDALVASVDSATKLFQNTRVEYIDVLFAQRDLMDARTVFIETKKQQLSAIVNAYQALGGAGNLLAIRRQGDGGAGGPGCAPTPLPGPQATGVEQKLPPPQALQVSNAPPTGTVAVPSIERPLATPLPAR